MYSEVYNVKWLENWWNCPDRNNFYACSGFVKEVAHFVGNKMGMKIVYLPPPLPQVGFGKFVNGSWTPGIWDQVSNDDPNQFNSFLSSMNLLKQLYLLNSNKVKSSQSTNVTPKIQTHNILTSHDQTHENPLEPIKKLYYYGFISQQATFEK
jgi:hypothetical protein